MLIIGIGNEFRRDDGVGLVVVRQLRSQLPEGVEVEEQSGEGTSLMEAWEDADTVILVDAVQSGAQPGTLHRFDARRQPLPDQMFSCSSHTFGVAQAVEMARELDRLPRTLIVHGIEGTSFKAGTALSPEVEEVAQHVAGRILSEVAELTHPAGTDPSPQK